jgi:ABC-type branched-subunit amino acid transport system ATPase component
MMEKRVLEIENVKKSFAVNYSGKGNALGTEFKNVINGLSVDIDRGKVTALVGGNGAGKTTLFNMVSGLLRPDSGSINFYGKDKNIRCSTASPWEISDAGVGRLFQGTRVFGELSIMDNLILQSRNRNIEFPFYNIYNGRKSRQSILEIKESINEKLRRVDEFDKILKQSQKPALSLSYAQQRMLSMAGLLIGDYELLLMDEPSSGLSPESFSSLFEFMELVKKDGKSIFLIEHNMEFVRKTADHCYFIAEGKVKHSGSPEEILNKEDVKTSYLI